MSVVLTRSAVHTAALDPMTGSGLVLCPHPDADLSFDLESHSLAAADFLGLIERLSADGWESLEDDEGYGDDPYCLGYLVDSVRPDGRALVVLLHRDPIGNPHPSMSELVDSYSEPRAALWELD